MEEKRERRAGEHWQVASEPQRLEEDPLEEEEEEGESLAPPNGRALVLGTKKMLSIERGGYQTRTGEERNY